VAAEIICPSPLTVRCCGQAGFGAAWPSTLITSTRREDIDKEAGEGVVPPGAPDLAGLFINCKIDVGALQRLGHEQPRHARAGDDNPKFAISHDTSQNRTDLRQPNFKPVATFSTSQVSKS
jgi:hypothetical protein